MTTVIASDIIAMKTKVLQTKQASIANQNPKYQNIFLFSLTKEQSLQRSIIHPRL